MHSILILILLLALGTTAHSQSAPTIFYNATVIDINSGKLLRKQEVIVADGKILSVQPVSKLSRHKGSQLIDIQGKYIVPGFWDMHVHTLVDKNYQWQLPLLLANGIIGIREMWGRKMQLADSLKWEMQSGHVPFLHLTASGHIIDGKKVYWPGQLSAPDTGTAIRLVDSLIREKVDFIKTYSYLEPEVFIAIAKRCREKGIPFAGHVPHKVWVSQAARAGMASMEHLYGFLIEACAYPDSAMKLRWEASRNFEEGLPAKYRIEQSRKGEGFMLDHFSEQRMRELARTLREQNTYVVPTVVTNQGLYRSNDTAFTNDERMAYLSEGSRSYWKETVVSNLERYSPEDWQLFQKRFTIEKRIIKILDEEKVSIMAGTDFDNPYAFPGFGLHDELELLVEFGMEPLDALRTATINPVKYLKLTDSLGTIEKGKRADFVILEDNPLSNIANTRKVFAVMNNGRLYTTEELTQMKVAVLERNKPIKN